MAMELRKYKYYFKKTKSAIAKDIFYWLMLVGAVYIAASSPYFIVNLLKSRKKWQKYSRKKITDTFYNFRRRGLIEIKREGKQIYIGLTEKGKEKAGYMQINDLDIKKPRSWDKKWRVIMFDILELKKTHREAFRGKLKELGFRQLQKSVWVHPFECRAEIELLRSFLGLSKSELRIMTVDDIEDDERIKKDFGLA